jgi:ankyrin repeat protein
MALHIACEEGHLPIVEFLISHGADIHSISASHYLRFLLLFQNISSLSGLFHLFLTYFISFLLISSLSYLFHLFLAYFI